MQWLSKASRRLRQRGVEKASNWQIFLVKKGSLTLLILNLLLCCDKPIFNVILAIRKALLSSVEWLSSWMPRGDVPDRILVRELEFVTNKLAKL